MTNDNPTPPPDPDIKSFWRHIRSDLVTGSLVLAPVVITFYLMFKIFQLLDSILGRMISSLLRDSLGVTFFGPGKLPGVGLIGLLILLILTGWTARTIAGRTFIAKGQSLLNNIPLVNRIHKAFQQIGEAISKGRSDLFKRAVLVEYPRQGVYSVGIVTAENIGKLQKLISEPSVPVFIVSTPNPTTGFMIFVPRKDLIELNMTVEEALKLVVSGGIISAFENNPPQSLEK